MTLLRAVCDGAVVGWGRWADVGGDVAVAGPGSGGGPGALRLPPWGTVGRGRQLRRVAPAARGDCGAVTAAAALSRLLPGVTAGLVRIGV